MPLGKMSTASSDGISHEKMYTQHNEQPRQMIVSLTPEQYDRLYSPRTPEAAKADLAKRLANPTLLGLLGLIVPFTPICFALLNFQGADTNSPVGFTGVLYFFGGIALSLAGVMEFILGNAYQMTIYIGFACHWLHLAFNQDPTRGLSASYAEGALSHSYNAGQGHYQVAMLLFVILILVGATRTNIPFILIFVSLICVFGFQAKAYYNLAYHPTADGVSDTLDYFKIAGGFGMVAVLSGWYLAIILVCAFTATPCYLPLFDLSTGRLRLAPPPAVMDKYAKNGTTTQASREVTDVEKAL